MTKEISFCLWGDDPKYIVGAIKNAQLAPKIYPGWRCVFWMGKPWYTDVINDLAACGDHVKVRLVDAPGDWRGMFWRFWSAFEPDVDVWISRDCDSRLSAREAAAVNNWIRGPSLIHVMRDHPYHNTPILGGMWGAKRGAIPDMEQLLKDWNQEDRWQTDQEFLAQVIYPRCRSMIQEHDEFFAQKRFPTKRNDYEFVGQIFDENDNTVAEHVEILKRAIG